MRTMAELKDHGTAEIRGRAGAFVENRARRCLKGEVGIRHELCG